MYQISSIAPHIQLGILHLPDYEILMKLEAKREIEKGGTRFLLEKLFKEPIDLQYTPEGKPYLNNKNCHISITHSHDKLAIIVNEQNETGIDIELIREKVIKIQHKFLSPQELLDANNETQKLITYWACKEALYKLFSKKEVDFIANLFVNKFDNNDRGETIGEIKIANFNKKINLHYEKTGEYMLVYTLNEIG